MNSIISGTLNTQPPRRSHGLLSVVILLCGNLLLGCADAPKVADRGYFTSGSHDADQRAEQRMIQAEQLKHSGGATKLLGTQNKATLYDRLGGEAGISSIVEDFVSRALADPRVNWQRHDVRAGGFSIHRGQSMTWNPNGANLANLKKHLGQFLSLASGGPTRYDGREMKEAHSHMHITNAEFDASIGDMKATLDKLQIPDAEQKELLAIIESTRPQVVEER